MLAWVARQLLLFLPDGGLPPLGLFQSQKIGMARTAGARPIRNIIRQALPIVPASCSLPSAMPTAPRACCRWRKGPAASPARTARAVGHDLGHERHAHGELAADAQAGQEAVEREIPDANDSAESPVKAE